MPEPLEAFLCYENPWLLIPGAVHYLACDPDDAFDQALAISQTAHVTPLYVDHEFICEFVAVYQWCGGPRLVTVEATTQQEAQELIRQLEHIAVCCIPNVNQT